MTELYYNTADTICAISTPPGTGGIAVIRIAGPQAMEAVGSIWRGKTLKICASHTAHLGNIVDTDGYVIDQAVATIYRSPHSYTGDDTVELAVHGSRWIQRKVIQLLLNAGARMALPGEFTQRAFAAGNLDLAQAEAVADLIAAKSKAAHKAAMNQMRGGTSNKLQQLRGQLLNFASLIELELDFSDQDVEFVSRQQLIETAVQIQSELTRLHDSFDTGAAVKDGFPVAIIGNVNAGKSSLLNAILNDNRAIVSDIPGTTRDIVEDTKQIGDYLVRFLDTAGLRDTTDQIEQIGIQRTRHAANTASVVLNVIDAANPGAEQGTVAPDSKTIIVLNKTDIATPQDISTLLKKYTGATTVPVSAKNNSGIEKLMQTILQKIQQTCDGAGDILITAQRHADAIRQAIQSNRQTIQALIDGIPADLVAHHLRQTLHHLATITGQITTPSILSNIFSTFCIGK